MTGHDDIETPLDTRASGDTADRSASGFHPVNVGHLVMGVAFAALTVVWLLVATDTLDPLHDRWIFPLPWVLAGVAGLAAVLLRRKRRP